MIIIENGVIVGNTAPNIYGALKPWRNEAGIPRWILDPAGEAFSDSDGKIYHLRERTQPEIDAVLLPDILTIQAEMLTDWNIKVNQFISQFFDVGTQISFIKIHIQNEADRPLIAQVDAWVTQVMAYYYTVKAQIQAATTIAELEALQASMEFGALFGVQGSLLAVPDVRLSQFF